MKIGKLVLFVAPLLLLTLSLLAACSGEEEKNEVKSTGGKPGQTSTIAVTPIAGGGASKPRPAAHPVPTGSGFDFYVLSLSWSPSWCLDNDPAGRTQQCATGTNRGFIVHGLWPQNEHGYPEFCRSPESDRVPETLGRTLFDLMPSMGLIGHEWRKHGTCSGLSQSEYFAVMRAARDRVKLPASLNSGNAPPRLDASDLATALVAANPGLRRDGIAVTCDAGQLDEVRVCFDKSLNFRACGEITDGACTVKTLTLPHSP